jgi:hypothetical protein
MKKIDWWEFMSMLVYFLLAVICILDECRELFAYFVAIILLYHGVKKSTITFQNLL